MPAKTPKPRTEAGKRLEQAHRKGLRAGITPDTRPDPPKPPDDNREPKHDPPPARRRDEPPGFAF
jgi:hypothetical protein